MSIDKKSTSGWDEQGVQLPGKCRLTGTVMAQYSDKLSRPHIQVHTLQCLVGRVYFAFVIIMEVLVCKVMSFNDRFCLRSFHLRYSSHRLAFAQSSLEGMVLSPLLFVDQFEKNTAGFGRHLMHGLFDCSKGRLIV